MSSVGAVVRTRSVYFVDDDTSREAIDGTAVVSLAELDGVDDAEEVRDLVRERGAAHAES
jgi:putative transcriptional regulator